MTWQRKLGISFGWVVTWFLVNSIYDSLFLKNGFHVTIASGTIRDILAVLIVLGEFILVFSPIIMLILLWFNKPQRFYRKTHLYS